MNLIHAFNIKVNNMESTGCEARAFFLFTSFTVCGNKKQIGILAKCLFFFAQTLSVLQ